MDTSRDFTKYLQLLLISFLLSSCYDQASSPLTEVEFICAKFEYEAKKRGYKVRLKDEGIKFKFGALQGIENAKFNKGYFNKTITIDSLKWKFHSLEFKEYLVFHELGHCILKRNHSNLLLPLGECKSWMREDNSVCGINLIDVEWRKYYLDELFNQATEIPKWYDTTCYLSTSSKNLQLIKSIQLKARYTDSLIFLNDTEFTVSIINNKPPDETAGISIITNGLRINIQSKLAFPPRDDGLVLLEATIFTNKKYGSKIVVDSSNEYLIYKGMIPSFNNLDIRIEKSSRLIYIYLNNRLIHLCHFNKNLFFIEAISSGKNYTLRLNAMVNR